MSNMRGRGYEPTGPQAQLIEKLRNNATYGQQQAEHWKRAAVGIGMGSINLAGGAVQGARSNARKAFNEKRQGMQDNIDKQTRNEAESRGPLPAYDPSKNMAPEPGNAPAWLGQHGEGASGHTFSGDPGREGGIHLGGGLGASPGDINYALQAEANNAIQRQSATGSAMESAIGGYDTAGGLEGKSMNADAENNDLNTGKQLMGAGGMLNSLPRVPR